MRLSIIIVNYNTCGLLRTCLASIAAGCAAVEYEVWVVDNHSRDDSLAMAAAEFPAVKVIANPANYGFARANNLALRQAAGDYYLLLNSDAQLLPGAGDALVAFMDAHPEAGFASPQLLNADGSLQHTAAAQPSLATELLPKPLLRWFAPGIFYSKDFGAGKEAAAVDGVVGAALMVRRTAAAQIGFYDEDYFFFFEETDWCARVRAAGWKILIAPQITVVHAQGATARQTPVAVRIEYWRSRYTYFRKHFSPLARGILYASLWLKNTANLLLNLPCALFSSRSAYRVRLASALYRWHCCGRPASMGISTAGEPSAAAKPAE